MRLPPAPPSGDSTVKPRGSTREGRQGWHPWRLNLALWAGYVVLGRVGLLLALPPGYASPLFVPAGLALAACVTGGWRLLPAVALGAISVNLIYPWLNTGSISAAAVLAALASGVGATLQAGIGGALFRRYIDPAIGSGRDVARFLLLAPAAPRQHAGQHHAGQNGPPGGWATPAASCWPRRCCGSPSAARARCGGGAARWSACRCCCRPAPSC